MKSIQYLRICALLSLSICSTLTAGAQRRTGAAKRTAAHKSQSAAQRAAATPAKPAPAIAPVTLIGEFKKPGPAAFKPGMTAKAAIEAAGGFTDLAETSVIKLNRAGKGWAGTFDGRKALDDDAINNVALKPGDSLVAETRRVEPTAKMPAADSAKPKDAITAPASMIATPAAEAASSKDAISASGDNGAAAESKEAVEPAKTSADETKAVATTASESQAADPGRIAILGEAVNTGVFQYKPAMLKDALAAASLKKSADRGRIVIYRDGINVANLKQAKKINYDLNKVEKGKAEDVALLPGDVVQIPLHRDHSFFGQISGTFNHMTGEVAHVAGAAVRPLIGVISPAAGLLLNAVAPARRGTTAIAPTDLASGAAAPARQRAPTKFETAMLDAIKGEPVDVQQRILAQVQASLQTAK